MQSVSSPSPPSTPHILLSAAGNAANEKRNKTIMNCFRDRTPSYTRPNYYNQNQRQPQQRIYEQSGTGSSSGSGRPEAVVFLKELRSSPNKLTLLKSSSTRDLSRLVDEVTIVNFNSNGSVGMSTSSSSSSSNHKNTSHTNTGIKNLQDLEKRFSQLEKDFQEQKDYTKCLETQIQDLKKRVDELTEVKQVEKRKKSASVRKNVSNLNTSVQPSRFNAWLRLTNLWKHRPSIESLKQKNIYNDEPCFDTEIEMVLKHEIHKTVPKIVVDCCDIVYEKYRESSVPVEGIYRQCGDYNKIQTLRFRIDGNDYESLRQPNIDIHTVTGVLKLFLREIKSPLISSNEAKTFIGKPNQWFVINCNEDNTRSRKLIYIKNSKLRKSNKESQNSKNNQ
ncbi:rho GTPase-activating protein 12 isoform X2 [Teleopsis dalmanni]|uniref:rho GTPase-activating protein 12 isoform X2 n=2 Tax=Teleopsis dalmanni TaxID=139649 RepID=UPI0018CEB056|nr:rho GTPase-activating protein 12 isoform X2 [Teleopsis dalmanni]